MKLVRHFLRNQKRRERERERRGVSCLEQVRLWIFLIELGSFAGTNLLDIVHDINKNQKLL
jgi:hypothetical protein